MNNSFVRLFTATLAIFFGFFLYHVFELSPDSSFPSGRISAYCICYILILVGVGYVYMFGVQMHWLSGNSLGTNIIIAVGLSLFSIIPFEYAFGKYHQSFGIVLGIFVLRLPDRLGRAFMMTVCIMFFAFTLMAWWGVLTQLLNRDSSDRSNRHRNK